MSTRESAVEACARGWAVFPCVPGQKRPAVKDRWEERATTDPAVVERYWPRDANVGVACGPSGLVVVDCDVAKDGQRPLGRWAEGGVTDGVDALAMLAECCSALLPLDGPLVRTPSGGLHLYFRAPAGARVHNSASKIAWKVDVRAVGGYVVGAGSKTSLGTYEALGGPSEAAPLPEWLLTACSTSTGPTPRAAAPVRLPRRQKRRDEQYRFAALRNSLERLLAAGEGGRNTALNAEAYGVVKSGWAAAEVQPVLLEAALRIGLPEAEARRTLTSALGGAA